MRTRSGIVSARTMPASPKCSRSASVSGSSAAAQRRWPVSTAGLPGLLTAASAGRASSSSGWLARYWSSWSSPATSTPRPSERRPARPHCWRSDAMPPGEPDADCAVEQPDVDAQLQRAGGHDAQQPAVHQAGLDLAPLLGGVAGAVGSDPRRQLGRVQEQALAGVAVYQLGGTARLREHDRAQLGVPPGLPSAWPPRPACWRGCPARRPATAGSTRRCHAPRPATRPGRPRTPAARPAPRPPDPGWRWSPTPAGTAAARRRRRPRAAAGPARWRRASRTRRGRRAPRRRRRSAGWRSRPPRPSGRAGCRRGACRGSSAPGSPSAAPAGARRRGRRRRSMATRASGEPSRVSARA